MSLFTNVCCLLSNELTARRQNLGPGGPKELPNLSYYPSADQQTRTAIVKNTGHLVKVAILGGGANGSSEAPPICL